MPLRKVIAPNLESVPSGKGFHGHPVKTHTPGLTKGLLLSWQSASSARKRRGKKKYRWGTLRKLLSQDSFFYRTLAQSSRGPERESSPWPRWELQPALAFFTPATPTDRLPKASLRKNDKAISYLIHLCCWVHSRTKAGKTQVRNSILLPFIRRWQTKPRFPGSLGSSRAPVVLPSLLAVLS